MVNSARQHSRSNPVSQIVCGELGCFITRLDTGDSSGRTETVAHCRGKQANATVQVVVCRANVKQVGINPVVVHGGGALRLGDADEAADEAGYGDMHEPLSGLVRMARIEQQAGAIVFGRERAHDDGLAGRIAGELDAVRRPRTRGHVAAVVYIQAVRGQVDAAAAAGAAARA